MLLGALSFGTWRDKLHDEQRPTKQFILLWDWFAYSWSMSSVICPMRLLWGGERLSCALLERVQISLSFSFRSSGSDADVDKYLMAAGFQFTKRPLKAQRKFFSYYIAFSPAQVNLEGIYLNLHTCRRSNTFT